MKFVDEAKILVQGGKGGDGALSFRREKYVAFGGPDGGDGGMGANVWLVGDTHMNTLVDFRYKREFKGKGGQNGMGSDCTGRGADDLFVPVPVGTVIEDASTGEIIADVKRAGQKVLVAKGGAYGLGNARFKTSTNRAPRKTTPGKPGESRHLNLELKLLADVGLLGLPNAGKSTLISSISAAKPKVADYPFTTLHPNLGVVRLDSENSFVVADVPGLIEGAADGAGLGIQFLRHLARTSLMLHLVDISPADGSDPIDNIKMINAEVAKYGKDLLDKPMWVVLNKVDVVGADVDIITDLEAQIKDTIGKDVPIFHISAITGANTNELCWKIANHIKSAKNNEEELDEEDSSLDEDEL